MPDAPAPASRSGAWIDATLVATLPADVAPETDDDLPANVAASADMPVLNCVDLFAGAGGFSLAARNAALHVRLAIEFDKHAAATYRANLCKDSSRPIVLAQDITELNATKTFRDVFDHGDHCDLMLGGPPCQGFSTHRINDAGVDDKRNDLIHTYFDFVRAFSPNVFLMENVPGMLWDRHKAALQRFYVEGALAGYKLLKPVVVDARDYGVPQRRKRVFILGIRKGVDVGELTWPPPVTHGSETARKFNSDLLPWKSCKDVFAAAPANDPNNVHMTHSDELIEAFRNTPINGGSRKDSGRILDCHRNHDGHKDVYGRIDPLRPGPTMTTACINPSKGRFVHPIENHGITVRQAARMQTFPDSYVFAGGLMAAGKQVGNAVPVELACRLIEHLVPILRRARTDVGSRCDSKHGKEGLKKARKGAFS
jgi:DNA (cytosine-5)-methyltransferase 1